MNIIEDIRKQQRTLPKLKFAAEAHRPQMLYIGCIDARLDPVHDIGIPQGTALIHRKIGALVAGLDDKGNPLDLSEAASIEFAVNVMHVKDIVVSAHTECGGIGACVHPEKVPHTDYLSKYLKPVYDWWKTIMGPIPKDTTEECELEKSSVRKSLDNLEKYPCVREAMKRGLQLHGWVIDTGTKSISEMDRETGQFRPMAELTPNVGGNRTR